MLNTFTSTGKGSTKIVSPTMSVVLHSGLSAVSSPMTKASPCRVSVLLAVLDRVRVRRPEEWPLRRLERRFIACLVAVLREDVVDDGTNDILGVVEEVVEADERELRLGAGAPHG